MSNYRERLRRAGMAAISAAALAVSALAVGACDELEEKARENAQESDGTTQDDY